MSERRCECGFLRHCHVHGEIYADIAEIPSEQLARIFSDIKAGGDRRAAWDALSEEDRYTLYSLLVDELEAGALLEHHKPEEAK